MLRTLALIGATGVLTLAVPFASAAEQANCPSCQNQNGYQATPWVETTGAYCQNCDNSNCRHCNRCGHGNCLHCSLCDTKGWPDQGWNPPAHYPVNRDGIWYRNMWPQAWYGNPGGGFIANSPMVYQPTDTTQLGYSYAKVPTWQPMPGMIPRVPCPDHFHARVCVPREPQYRLPNPCQSGYGGAGCPSCQQGYATQQYIGQNYVPQPNTGAQRPAAAPTQSVPVPHQQMPAPTPKVALPQQYQQVSYTQDEAPGVFRLANLKRLFN